MLLKYFRHNTTVHSQSNAYLLAVLSYYIYQQPSLVNGNWKHAFNGLLAGMSTPNETVTLDTFTINSSSFIGHDTEAAIVTSSKFIIVIFRGTEGPNIKDWMTNLNHVMVPVSPQLGGKTGMQAINGVNVHWGFNQALDTKYNSIKNKVVSRRNNQQKVFLTGHSLGGALATLCAYKFVRMLEPIPVQGVYTYGSPRVGDIHFRNEYNQRLKDKTFRWVYHVEFAPNLPEFGPYNLSPLPIKYYHIGRLNRVLSDGSVSMNHSSGDTSAGFGPTSISDHELDRMCRKLRTRLSKKKRKSVNEPSYLVYKDPAYAMSIY